MAAKYKLMPNEAIIIKEVNVRRGDSIMNSSYSNELILTNQNIIYIGMGMFGNVKDIYKYPLDSIKRFNGRPQVMAAKRSNGTEYLEVYFSNGTAEAFSFQLSNKKTINKWINEINKVISGGNGDEYLTDEESGDSELVDAVKEVKDQLKEVGEELLGAFGVSFKKKHTDSASTSAEKVSKKCLSCSAPLVGYKGTVVKCKYCNTEQTL